jgi:hypothetical protein
MREIDSSAQTINESVMCITPKIPSPHGSVDPASTHPPFFCTTYSPHNTLPLIPIIFKILHNNNHPYDLM